MNLSLLLIKKLKRKRKYYEMASKKRKVLYDILSVLYMAIKYLTFAGFIYNLIYGLTHIIGWFLSKVGANNSVLLFLGGWPGLILNFFFPFMILGFVFIIVLDVWVGDIEFFETTFKYRVFRI